MNQEDLIQRLAKKIQAPARSSTPAVQAIRPEIRTTQYAAIGVFEGEAKARIDNGQLIAAFVSEWGFDVPIARKTEFHKWLADNEANISAACPKGIQYKGTYVVCYSSEKGAGRYRTIWAFDGFNGIEQFRTAMAADSPFKKLVEELQGYRDMGDGTTWSDMFLSQPRGRYDREGAADGRCRKPCQPHVSCSSTRRCGTSTHPTWQSRCWRGHCDDGATPSGPWTRSSGTTGSSPRPG